MYFILIILKVAVWKYGFFPGVREPYVTRDIYFVFVNSIQLEKDLGTFHIYLILTLCLKFYVCSRIV